MIILLSSRPQLFERLDNTIHRINLDSAIGFLILIHRIAIYPQDSASQRLNDWGQGAYFLSGVSYFLSG